MLLSSPQEYLHQMIVTSKSEAVKMWRSAIKQKWNWCCAYCGENKQGMTIDHIIPQALGGTDELTNVLCCCEECNKSKSHNSWEDWYIKQYFFNQNRYDAIMEWCRIKTEGKTKRYIRGKNGTPTRTQIYE
jgi:hypothetical protein